MSEKRLRGRVPVSRRIRPPHPSPSTHRLRRRVVIVRRSSSKKPLKFINRCNSVPALLTVDVGGATEDPGGLMSISRSRPDIFSSAPELVLPYSPSKIQRDSKELHMHQYNKDAKVVVNVTVEGCPGAIRAMVRLGSTVEETMKIVKHQYESEGRCPRLDQRSISTFELHPSHFSLRCLDKSDKIGNFGSRSFYMRKRSNENSIIGPEIISTRRNGSPSPPPSPTVLFPNFICRNFKKVIRLLGKLLGCLDG
ncbi:uncharacterized protein At4g22758-like [Cynara cardunculus var. scolymus]|uniref:DUF7054 domain-containing protein n=1 Tax=Cynara cardunculus var. scolymus TaxID=59895 RepID=A0A103XG37_CYNCS|nr:uncharacterized protein At4g22758-like [Cynara cardunculus var. scolymus]KVH90029.1 hypothetical protein Ccrd_007968 [Cynara cardunculus var. scolymus]